MSKQSELWSQIAGSTARDSLLYYALRHTIRTLGEMIDRPLEITDVRCNTRSFSQMMVYGDDPEAETVGVYLRISNDLPGEAMLLFSPADAMYLADWLLELRPGTTTSLNDLSRSALAEVGNQTLSSFLNAIANMAGTVLTPSPPAVKVDMLATLLEAAITFLSIEPADELLVIEAEFANVQSELLIEFWLLPDPVVIKSTNN